jgi:hypothetical protein
VNNAEKANLSFQRKAVEEFHSCHAAIEVPQVRTQALPSSASENGSRSNTTPASEDLETDSGDDAVNVVRSNMASSSQIKHTASVVIDDDTEDEDIRCKFSNLSLVSL